MSIFPSEFGGFNPHTVQNFIYGKLQNVRAYVVNPSLKEGLKQHKALTVALTILLATVIIYHLCTRIWKASHKPGSSFLPTSLQREGTHENLQDNEIKPTEKRCPFPSESDDDTGLDNEGDLFEIDNGADIHGRSDHSLQEPTSSVSSMPASIDSVPKNRKTKPDILGRFIDRRSKAEKVSDTFDRLIQFALRQMPDKLFHEDGVFRIAMGASDTTKWEKYLMGKKPGESSKKLEKMDGLMGAYLLKRLVRKMHLFDGELQKEVLAFGANPPEKEEEQVQKLEALIKQLPLQKKQRLKLFLELISRVYNLSTYNRMNIEGIAKSINDTLSPIIDDPSIPSPLPRNGKGQSSSAQQSNAQQLMVFHALMGDDKAGKVRVFTQYLITHYYSIFSTDPDFILM